jgi:hypothetical protein
MPTSAAPALSPLNGKSILMSFDGAEMSSDAGLTLLREIEHSHDCVFRNMRPPIPITSGHLFRRIRPPVTRCREAVDFGYQV